MARAVLAAVWLVGMMGVFSTTAMAAEVRLGNVLPGGAMIHKNMHSMQELKFSHLVEQQTDYSCGAASVATILRYGYHMKDITEPRVLKGLLKVADPEVVRKQGFSLLDIKHYVESIGLHGRGYRVSPQTLARIQVPTIVLLNLNGYYHFVVLRKVEGNQVFIADPAVGNHTMRLKDFIADWQNQIVFAVIGPGYDAQSALAQPQAVLSARELHDIYTPAPSAQLIGFGLQHVGLF